MSQPSKPLIPRLRCLATLLQQLNAQTACDAVNEAIESIESTEALRQSQSLPAGAVAGLVGKWRINSEICSGTGALERAVELSRCADQLEQALQADAREKGESPSLNQIPKPCAYPPVDSETGADTGSCCHHAYADGWNECRDEAIRLATQPAQASEKDNG